MIISKQSLINSAAQSILDAEKLVHPASVEKALTSSGEMLFGNVAEIDEADQIDILSRIGIAVCDQIVGGALEAPADNSRFSKLMGFFANGFVSASATMGLVSIDHNALRNAVATTLSNSGKSACPV